MRANDAPWFPPGQLLRCVRPGDYDLLCGNVYVALGGKEEGILSYRPYVTVLDERGEAVQCHASRFELVD